MNCYWCEEPARVPDNRYCVSCGDHVPDGLALAKASSRLRRSKKPFSNAWHARIWALSGAGPTPFGAPVYPELPEPWKEFTS